MSQYEKVDVKKDIAQNAHATKDTYEKMYKHSVDDPDSFWAEQSQNIHWYSPFRKVSDWSFEGDIKIKWFIDGKLNVSYNCIDRHIAEGKGDQTAILWEPDEPGAESQSFTYTQLRDRVSQLANGLKKMGVKKGDRVTIYLPMIPEAAMSMLACARIGAVHSVIFAGFSPQAIKDRVIDCDSEFILTADEGRRGGKTIGLKANVDEALKACPDVKKVLVVKNTGASVNMTEGRDLWYSDLCDKESTDCPPEEMSSEDPLFILYTSGSTGKPKGVLHTSGGYLVYASVTHKYVFDYKPGEIYWCGADVGWITGHSYMVYGPLANGATTLLHEGVPNYPSPSRVWEIIDKYQVNIFYTAPTAIRALRQKGDEFVTKTSRKSLRVLGTVGEPINPEAWKWYYETVGDSRCPVVDTWWQTETGGILITPLPGATDLKPGSATKPFFGIQPLLVNEKGEELTGAAEGHLCFKTSWPGQMRTVYKNHTRFKETYFSTYPGLYFSGDGCRRDEDGYYWITGRVDDVLNVSGHRLGTAEIESSLVAHEGVAEAAVVGYPHEIKGQGIYAYVLLYEHHKADDEYRKELINWVRQDISPIASPDKLQFVSSLPKTRSGKIMRRILRKIASNDFENLGDTSTLADPSVVDSIVDQRLNR